MFVARSAMGASGVVILGLQCDPGVEFSAECVSAALPLCHFV